MAMTTEHTIAINAEIVIVVVTVMITTGETPTTIPLEDIKIIIKKVLRLSKRVTMKLATTRPELISQTIEVTIIVEKVDIIITIRITETITIIPIMKDLAEIIRTTKNKLKVKRTRSKKVLMKMLKVIMKVSEVKEATVELEVVEPALTRVLIAIKIKREKKITNIIKVKMPRVVNSRTLDIEVVEATIVELVVVTVVAAVITNTTATMIAMIIGSRIMKMMVLKQFASEVKVLKMINLITKVVMNPIVAVIIIMEIVATVALIVGIVQEVITVDHVEIEVTIKAIEEETKTHA
mmetsp:Transcript_26726/g.19140  ORF Transcript_26726/g.19140 Transcript_26726/m.19140 type:complete len:294 (+) Transcript_26726:1363-2244(+)